MDEAFNAQGDDVEQAVSSMTDVELNATVTALHAHERRLLVAGDVDGARQAAMNKAICLSVQARRGQ